jgi:hypothetical protein
MTENLNTGKRNLQRTVTTQRIMIVVLAAILIIGGVWFTLFMSDRVSISSLAKHVRSALVDPGKANKNIGAYRDDGAFLTLSFNKKAKVHGVLHASDELSNYTVTTFKNFKDAHSLTAIKPGYHWEVGIYPMMCRVDFLGEEKPRIGFYFIPTMVKDDNPDDIIDYFDTLNDVDLRKIYYPNWPDMGMVNDEFIFDEGHLWP